MNSPENASVFCTLLKQRDKEMPVLSAGMTNKWPFTQLKEQIFGYVAKRIGAGSLYRCYYQ